MEAIISGLIVTQTLEIETLDCILRVYEPYFRYSIISAPKASPVFSALNILSIRLVVYHSTGLLGYQSLVEGW